MGQLLEKLQPTDSMQQCRTSNFSIQPDNHVSCVTLASIKKKKCENSKQNKIHLPARSDPFTPASSSEIFVIFLLKIFSVLLQGWGKKLSCLAWKTVRYKSVYSYFSHCISHQTPFKHLPTAGLKFLHFPKCAPHSGSWDFNTYFCLPRVPFLWLTCPSGFRWAMTTHHSVWDVPWDVLTRYLMLKHILLKHTFHPVLSLSGILKHW